MWLSARRYRASFQTVHSGRVQPRAGQIFERISQHHAFRHRFLAERIKRRRDFAAQPVLGRVQPGRDDLRLGKSKRRDQRRDDRLEASADEERRPTASSYGVKQRPVRKLRSQRLDTPAP